MTSLLGKSAPSPPARCGRISRAASAGERKAQPSSTSIISWSISVPLGSRAERTRWSCSREAKGASSAMSVSVRSARSGRRRPSAAGASRPPPPPRRACGASADGGSGDGVGGAAWSGVGRAADRWTVRGASSAANSEGEAPGSTLAPAAAWLAGTNIQPKGAKSSGRTVSSMSMSWQAARRSAGWAAAGWSRTRCNSAMAMGQSEVRFSGETRTASTRAQFMAPTCTTHRTDAAPSPAEDPYLKAATNLSMSIPCRAPTYWLRSPTHSANDRRRSRSARAPASCARDANQPAVIPVLPANRVVTAPFGVSRHSQALTARAHRGSVRRDSPAKKPGEPKSFPTCRRHARVVAGVAMTRRSTSRDAWASLSVRARAAPPETMASRGEMAAGSRATSSSMACSRPCGFGGKRTASRGIMVRSRPRRHSTPMSVSSHPAQWAPS
mmetsp:Transcript_4736/g.15517  ORF Transcript_4736/g.15517 Transcript_4736/m.15517 type:complete len:441 (-) Transcript_4736:522-1844(-)